MEYNKIVKKNPPTGAPAAGFGNDSYSLRSALKCYFQRETVRPPDTKRSPLLIGALYISSLWLSRGINTFAPRNGQNSSPLVQHTVDRLTSDFVRKKADWIRILVEIRLFWQRNSVIFYKVLLPIVRNHTFFFNFPDVDFTCFVSLVVSNIGRKIQVQSPNTKQKKI